MESIKFCSGSCVAVEYASQRRQFLRMLFYPERHAGGDDARGSQGTECWDHGGVARWFWRGGFSSLPAAPRRLTTRKTAMSPQVCSSGHNFPCLAATPARSNSTSRDFHFSTSFAAWRERRSARASIRSAWMRCCAGLSSLAMISYLFATRLAADQSCDRS